MGALKYTETGFHNLKEANFQKGLDCILFRWYYLPLNPFKLLSALGLNIFH